MYLPCSKITIGSKYFGGVHDIKIKRSIHTIGATASVKVPVTAVLRQTGTPPAYVETAQVIKAGDRWKSSSGMTDACTPNFGVM